MLDEKHNGQVFTPAIIVDHMLELVEYYEDNIYDAKIMEPSFGDGAFLIAIISKIIEEVKDPEKIKNIVQNNVFGIEKDESLYETTIQKLEKLLKEHNVCGVDFRKTLFCGDTLDLYKDFLNQFDIVIGNPPYVRIHNISNREQLKNFKFSSGNTDLYITFYEIGIQMSKSSGKLCYITPNSFLKNTSQQDFRDFLVSNKYVQEIFDFKHLKVFADADTYTCICLLNKSDFEYVSYNECVKFSAEEMYFEFTPLSIERFSELCYKKNWNLSNKLNDISFLEQNRKKTKKIKDIALVQNGVATLRDSIFIGMAWEDQNCDIPYMGRHTDKNKLVYFNNHLIESQILHRCVKASKFDGIMTNQYIIYPYNDSGPITEELLKIQYPHAYQYLLQNKNELLKRDLEKNQSWFLFGRSQGLKNTNQSKIVFKHIVNKSANKIAVWKLDNDVVVYSGLFTTGSELELIKEIFETEEFAKYCCLTGKDMSGGYAAVSSKIVKDFGIT